METALPFRHVAIIGVGLIGGSFALALRKHFPQVKVTAFDREAVISSAIARDAVHEGTTTLAEAVSRADLVYIALPIGPTLQALPAIASLVPEDTLVTDASSAKAVICQRAVHDFQTGARFLGGHPIAGKEVSGIENADSELFAGAPYALIGSEEDPDPRVLRFAELLREMGAKLVWCDAATHDWALSVVSHLPQLAALALARVVSDETDETGLPLTLAGRGLQDTLRLAGSPYAVWRDVFIANQDNVRRALDRLAQAIDHLRTSLSGRELEDEFRAANELFRSLRKEQQKTED
ncbi:MAG TPA: prephenate dehydrogenase [Candidatus Cybelea sp.]|nr:prephenate dehydrogenase [Candidatus Cybelea sp.]